MPSRTSATPRSPRLCWRCSCSLRAARPAEAADRRGLRRSSGCSGRRWSCTCSASTRRAASAGRPCATRASAVLRARPSHRSTCGSSPRRRWASPSSAYSDNVLTARAFAARHREQIDSNQEFLALGAANIGAGLCRASRSARAAAAPSIADSMGARTQLHSLVSLVLVIATLLWLGPLIAAFPLAALGAVVVYAALRLVDLAELRRFAAFRRSELVLALSTTVGGAALRGAARHRRGHRAVGARPAAAHRPPARRGARLRAGHRRHARHRRPPRRVQVPGLVVYRYDSPLFFANADDFLTRARRAVTDAQGRRRSSGSCSTPRPSARST